MTHRTTPPVIPDCRTRETTHPTVLTETQVAEMLGCSIQTLRNHRAQRKGLPYTKFGRFVRYFHDDIEAHLRDHRIDPEAR